MKDPYYPSPFQPPKDYHEPEPHTDLVGPEAHICPHDEVHGDFKAITTNIPGVIVMHFTAYCSKCGANFQPLGIPVAPEGQALSRRPSMAGDMRTAKLPMVIEGTPTRVTEDLSIERIYSKSALG